MEVSSDNQVSTSKEVVVGTPTTSRFTRSQQPPTGATGRDDVGGLLQRTQSSRFTRSQQAPPTGEAHRSCSHRSLGAILAFLQLGFIFLFVFGSTYSTELYSPLEYTIYRDIMAMLIIGFGYLMTFLRKYGLGAVGFVLMLTALGMQLSIFMEHFVHFVYYPENTPFPLPLTLTKLIDAEFFTATLLITYGAVLGRASPFQLVMIMISESFFYAINKVMLVFGVFGAEDVGGTMTIHMFGAYFGIAVTKALGQRAHRSGNEASNRFGDVIAFIGTTVLWVFWPSFVGATETGEPENEMRCVINTILALFGSTGAAFYLSFVLGKGKFDAVHIQNSTLAGGVAVGSSARLDMGPGGATLLGVLAGLVSVAGYFYSTPFLLNKFGINDTCGVHNLHGLPAVLGGLASAVFVTMDHDAEFLSYGRPQQAWRQIAATVATIALASVSGFLTGLLLVKTKNPAAREYDDSMWWWEDECYEQMGVDSEGGEDSDEGDEEDNEGHKE